MERLIKAFFQDPMIRKFIFAALGTIIIMLVFRLLKKNLFKHVKSENWYMTNKVLSFTSYVLIIFLLGVIFSDRLGGITVTLGLAGAGITFALREIIASLAGWLGIVFGGYYSTGDRVQLGGIKGDIIDIGMLRTTVMEVGEWVDADLYNGRIVRIANSYVFSEPVFNYSAEFPFLWDEINIPITYESDHDMAKVLLKDIADQIVGDYTKKAQIDWDRMVKRFILENQSIHSSVTVEITDNWVEYTLRYVVDYKKRRTIKNKLFMEILNQIKATDGAIELASTSLKVIKEKD